MVKNLTSLLQHHLQYTTNQADRPFEENKIQMGFSPEMGMKIHLWECFEATTARTGRRRWSQTDSADEWTEKKYLQYKMQDKDLET
jgi:hypothetical protein